MMPISGDHHLNMMMYLDDDSFKEAVKLKMLNQEATFRNQVQELHRLYQIQMMLTKHLQLKRVLTKQSVNCTSRGTFQSHLDANVSASVCRNLFDHHFSNKRDGRGNRENPVQVENCFPGDTESYLDDVELSLSIGEDTKRKRLQRKFCHQIFTSVSSQEIIDLEESSCTELIGDINPLFERGCIAGSADFRDPQDYRSNCFSVNRENEVVAHGVKRSLSFVDECKTHLEQNSLNEGVELFNASVHMSRKQIEELPDVGMSPVTKVFTSHKALCLDLNKPLPDELFFDPKDQPLDYLGGGFSGVTESVAGDVRKGLSPDATSCSLIGNNCSDEVSAILQQDMKFEVMASNSNNSGTSSRSGKALSPGNESNSRPSDCCDIHHGFLASSHHIDADQLGSNFTGRSDRGPRVAGVNDDILNDKNAVFTHLSCGSDPVGDLTGSPAACKPIFMTIDRSCSLKTMHSGIYLGTSGPSLINSSPNSESSQNESSTRDESKSESFDEKGNGAAPDDFLVRRGAISLLYLFLQSSRREHNCISKFDEVNESANRKRDQPQHSIDTYESMVLKQQESNTEDYCVTSNPLPEVIGMDNKDFGVKVRRGRRMKDFQKDILPSLASLSRHEISEDIRIMEGAMRSREYKRLRSKAREQKWCTPVKNKRSRLNYVGRKYYN